MPHHSRAPGGDGKDTPWKGAYLMASGLLPRFARTHGCPALAQFRHDGVSSSHLIFCERHRAQAVPFLRPPPGCAFWRGAGAASAVMPGLASIGGFLAAGWSSKPSDCGCVCRIGGAKAVHMAQCLGEHLPAVWCVLGKAQVVALRKHQQTPRLSPGYDHTKSPECPEVESPSRATPRRARPGICRSDSHPHVRALKPSNLNRIYENTPAGLKS